MYSIDGAARPAAGDRRFALKQATDAAHRRVEGVVQAASMFGSRAGYLPYLMATYEVRAGFEALLDAAGAELVWPDWRGRRIAGLVAQDIADLGEIAPPLVATAENVSSDLSSGELIGVLYVLEGSALGARVLVDLATEIGLSASFGARHLHAQAGDRAAWRSFLAMMSTAADPPCHQTANQTFEAFARAYERASS